MSPVKPGVVSVVIINYRGTDDTIEAVRQLRGVDWPRELLEVVVVENGSGDDSAQRLSAEFDDIELVISETNEGFAGGCNRGVAASSGEFIAFLNNDAKPDVDWIRPAVVRFMQSPLVGAVASRVLDWDGVLVDYIGSAMTWYGMGYKPFTAEPIPARYDAPQDVLFGTGSSMFVRRSAFEQLGGFDERYFMFFEDVDFGWRLNLAGWRFIYEPASLAYHKHHASMGGFGPHKETYLLERNALFTLYKNLGDESVDEALAAAMGLSLRRAVTRAKLDSSALDLRKGGSDEPTMEVSSQLIAASYAIDQFVEHLPGLRQSRNEIQSGRKVSEESIWRLFGVADAAVYHERNYLDGYEKLVAAFKVTQPPKPISVVIVTGDPIGAKLAGPAIRAWNMAELLSRTASVTLVSLTSVDETIEAPFGLVRVRAGDDHSFSALEAAADVIIFQGHAMDVFDSLRNSSKIIVVDLYNPSHLEQLEQGRELPAGQWNQQVRDATDSLNQQIGRGDFFLAASERQWPFWLGQLAGLGRINPLTYQSDTDLRGLLTVAPFGLSSVPPEHNRDVLKGVLPGIARDDKVLLWSGGLYNWFDPKTLIRAVAQLSKKHDSVRLFFQGTKHPHPGVPEMEIVAASRTLARELGVLDRSVFFNESWVDYADRSNYLLEADAGVSAHFSHVETTFSFRTRILDYLWAELPMVVTEGDYFAELVQAEKLGIVVPAEDVDALADALEKILFDEEVRKVAVKNIRRVRKRYFWEEALAPLVDFIAAPRHAADNGHFRNGTPKATRLQQRKPRSNFALVVYYMRNGGPLVVASKIRRRLSRRG